MIPKQGVQNIKFLYLFQGVPPSATTHAVLQPVREQRRLRRPMSPRARTVP
jgi:hypothetical protein